MMSTQTADRFPDTTEEGAHVTLAIRGMTCAACVARVERALSKVPGVAQAQVNYATETEIGRETCALPI